MKKSLIELIKFLLVPISVSVLFLLLSFLPLYRVAENRVYNILLKVKPPVEEREELLLLNVDELSIAQVGIWPWSRDVMADGLVLLREFNTAFVVFDIEYLDPSPQGIDARYMDEQLPGIMADQFRMINDNTLGFFNALINGNIPLSEAGDFVNELSRLNENTLDSQLEAIQQITRDNDLYLGNAARLNGSAYFTVNLQPEEIDLINVSDELLEFVEENMSVDIENTGKSGFFETAKTIQPAIMPIITQGAGAGFPNVLIDEDGVRRRIDLFIEYNGRSYPQLVMAPLLDYLGNPEIKVNGSRIVLKQAELPDGTVKNISIPLTSEGKMLINWPPKTFAESFHHLSYYKLVVHDLYLDNLVRNLEIMESAGYLSFYAGQSPLDYYRFAENLKQDIWDGNRDPADMDEFRQARDMFMEETGAFLNGDSEQALLNHIDGILAQQELDDQTRAAYRDVRDEVVDVFRIVREDYGQLQEIRSLLDEELKGSIVIIGHTATGTTDIGVNPFDKNYQNVGTHASVANTILTGDFITPLPWFISLLATVILAFALAFFVRSMTPKKSILVGSVSVLVVALIGTLLFAFGRIYLPLLTPILGLFLTFLSISIIKFIKSESEKSFLRNAFSRYLSADVINQLLQDPERLQLGGEEKNLSAVFTDIKGFSTVAEMLDPPTLVNLLNQYLTEMSDLIMSQQGTIDKYEGDAIISFFGAPVDVPDHPYRACLASVQMKRAERTLNERFLKDKLLPGPLLTRVGINTGDMVVGNMGTLQKMDYTIMGNSVNLAARLEGVNKQYGTWILTTEQVIDRTNGEFLTRKLDRVRVVGIHQPVRLYEILEENSHRSSAQEEGLGFFHDALDLFESKEWNKAEDLFRRVLEVLPGDGPSETFIKRCQDYQKKAPPANWDGVFNLGSK